MAQMVLVGTLNESLVENEILEVAFITLQLRALMSSLLLSNSAPKTYFICIIEVIPSSYKDKLI